jgi:hypothetical protein
MIKSIGNFLSDYGLAVFCMIITFLVVILMITVMDIATKRDRICLERQQVVVKFNGISYCSNLNSLSPIK